MAMPSKPWYRASKGTWYCTVNGKKVSLRVRGRKNSKAAREAWHQLMAEGKQDAPRPPRNPTVSEVLSLYLADCGGRLKPKTLYDYKWFLDPFSQQHGGIEVADLTPTLAESYARKPQWSDTTRHDFLGTLSGAFRWAERARVIARTPLVGLRRPTKASRGLDVLLTAGERERLSAAATPQFRPVLEVLWGTGMRPGEAAAITADNFDPELGVVRLREHKTAHKGKARVVYLPPSVVELLNGLKGRNPSGPLLRNRCGRPWTGWAVVKAMQATRDRAGLPGKVAYGLRHTFATDALAAGVPDAQVAELLGHSGTAMLHKHYSHLTAKARVLRGALDQVRGQA
jgi:integrase